ncbi:MAG: enolase C-terminal domain-like protein [Nanoarchaeota archaeon]|nr:hypothetical protein [Nanoarchaeota archaeon]
MKIEKVGARIIRDSRNEKTIQVLSKTQNGLFLASSPNGKSKGKDEAPAYHRGIYHDFEILEIFSDKISELNINNFSDLKKIENLILGKVGANTLFALESSVLKALANEKRKQVWELINEKARKFPFPVGNCIGGGLHSKTRLFSKKPDFQEFLIIPKTENFSDSVFLMKKIWRICKQELKIRNAKGRLNDENAWTTSLSNVRVLEMLKKIKLQIENEIGKEVDIGVDIAASSFYTGLVYNYKNSRKILQKNEQIKFVSRLIEYFGLDYMEDPLEENDFSGFSKLTKMSKNLGGCLIVGDDLIVSKPKKLERAIKQKSINAVIVKPNQVGSLIEISRLVRLAKKHGIKTIFSHRSGETSENILADLCFGFEGDYIKTGVMGEERDAKLRRMIEIEKSFG